MISLSSSGWCAKYCCWSIRWNTIDRRSCNWALLGADLIATECRRVSRSHRAPALYVQVERTITRPTQYYRPNAPARTGCAWTNLQNIRRKLERTVSLTEHI
jgi:hypothetical protein